MSQQTTEPETDGFPDALRLPKSGLVLSRCKCVLPGTIRYEIKVDELLISLGQSQMYPTDRSGPVWYTIAIGGMPILQRTSGRPVGPLNIGKEIDDARYALDDMLISFARSLCPKLFPNA